MLKQTGISEQSAALMTLKKRHLKNPDLSQMPVATKKNNVKKSNKTKTAAIDLKPLKQKQCFYLNCIFRVGFFTEKLRFLGNDIAASEGHMTVLNN